MASPAGTGAGPRPAAETDWTTDVTDRIVGLVDKVRDRTTVRVETAARAIVYGTIAATIGVVALVLLAVAAVRMLEVYLPTGGVWLPYLIVGGLFTLLGAFLLFVKTRPKQRGDG